MKQQRGFVLMTVLLFIQIGALWGISAWEQILLEQKLQADQKARHALLEEAEKRLYRLQGAILDLKQVCLIPAQPGAELGLRSLAWWKSQGCAESNHSWQSYAVVEKLDEDPCALPASTYYRLTLLLMTAEDEGQKVLLQITLPLVDANLEHCDDRRHSVDLGPQAWHALL
jgi:hypothetical protein